MLASLKRLTRRATEAVGLNLPGSQRSPIDRYLAEGRVPWSDGYSKFKNRVSPLRSPTGT